MTTHILQAENNELWNYYRGSCQGQDEQLTWLSHLGILWYAQEVRSLVQLQQESLGLFSIISNSPVADLTSLSLSRLIRPLIPSSHLF